MTHELIIAGFGGQGVLFVGKILAWAGMLEGKEVSWLPSYGPEQRGGTANVTVILSDQPISSPILNAYDIAILLTPQALDKFESKVKPGGILIYDSAVGGEIKRSDLSVYRIDATATAAEMRNAAAFNMLILGGLLKVVPLVTHDSVRQALKQTLSDESHLPTLIANEAAIQKGMQIIHPTGQSQFK